MNRARQSLALALFLAPWLGAAPAESAGWREQAGWQFRSPAESQIRLNAESLRLQADGVGNGAGSGGSVILPNGLSAGTSGSTVGNSTSGTTTYNVRVEGNGNTVHVDGYLNVETDQATGNQSSNVGGKAER